MTGSSPLHGVRVLERTTSIAGQSAGMLLADLGADVLRMADADDVERTGLPGWLCWNRGKRIVAADSDLEPLLQRADVLLTDAVPGEAGAPPDHSATAPALNVVWMPPIAVHGRWSTLPHDDLLLDAIGGFAAYHPATDERPVASVVPTRQLIQGALAAGAALIALIARRRDGWGRTAIVTGLHAEAGTLCTLAARSIDGPPVLSAGKLLPGPPNFRLYRAGDGRWFFLAALSPDLFIKALEALDRLDILVRDDIAGEFLNIMRHEVSVAVGAELDEVFARAPVEEWVQRLGAAGVPVAPVSDPAEWLQSDVIAHACPPLARAHPDVGEVLMPGTPFSLSVDTAGAGPLPLAGAPDDAAAAWTDVDPLPRPAGSPPGPDDRPLGGLRVIDLATFLAGPFVSTLLAASGADVVKIEPATGDPYSVFTTAYAIVHEHKERMRLDLRDAGARAAFLQIVGRADVVVDNLLPASLERLGLGPAVFEAANPNLVRCSLTAYGQTGPKADFPGFDPIMQTLSGLVAVQGGPDRPVASAAPAHDVATGCLAAVATLAALYAREHRGHGQRVFTSLAAGSTFLQSAELTTYPGRPARPIGGTDHPGPSSWKRFYRATDRWLAVSASTTEQRQALLAVLGRPDLDHVEDAKRAAELAVVIEGRGSAEWLALLGAAGVPACPAIARGELDEPFLVENHYSHVVDTPHVGRLEIVSGFTDWSHLERRPPFTVEQLASDPATVLGRWSERES